MNYLSIDLETSGLDPNIHSILEIGVVFDNGDDFDSLPRFHAYVDHENFTLNKYNLKFLTPAYYEKWLNKDKEALETTILKMFAWLQTVSPHTSLPIAGANFPSFDLQFLNKCEEFKKRGSRHFGHRYLDPKMYYITPEDKQIPGTEEICQRAGVKYDGAQAHDALYDAGLVVQLMRNAKHK